MANQPVKTDKEILPRRREKVPAKRAHSVALPTANSYPFPYEVPIPLARSARPEGPTTKQAASPQVQQRSASQDQDSTQEPCAGSNDMATTAVSKTSPSLAPSRPSRPPPRPSLPPQHSSPTPKPRIAPRPTVSPRSSPVPVKPRPPPMPKPAIRKVQSEDHGFTRSQSETVSVPSTGSSPVPVARSNSTITTAGASSVPAAAVAATPPIPKKRTSSFVSRTQNSMSASSLSSHSTRSLTEIKKPAEQYDPTKAAKKEEDNPYESVGFSNKDNSSTKDKDPEQVDYAEIGDGEEEDEDNGAYTEIGEKESDEEEEEEDRGDYEVVKQRSPDEEDEARGDYEVLKDSDDEEENDPDYVPMGSSGSTTPEPPARPAVRPTKSAPPVPNFPPPRPSRSPQPRITVETTTPIDDDEYTPMSFPEEHNSIYETIDLTRPIPPPRTKKKNKLKQKNSLPATLSPSRSFSSGSSPSKTKQAQMHQASAADRKQDNYVTLYKK